jgi:SulP family sulfate permease
MSRFDRHRARRALIAAKEAQPPDPKTLRQEAVAGLPRAIGAVPDGMASAVIVGVNPIYGLYASFVGPIVGGLTASTQRMVVTTTTAAALAAGSALGGLSPADRTGALFLLTLLTGAAMIAAGILRLGRYTRFVSLSVMVGFLTGVAANIVFGQLADLTGTTAEGDTALRRGLDVILHPGAIELGSLAVGLVALGIMVGLRRTRFSSWASIVALVVPSALALAIGSVLSVDDDGPIPQGIPTPHLPDLGLISFDLVTSALAIAVIVLVQGTGVAESAPNLDGSVSRPNRDFIAQGLANIASSLFRGQPVGGSVGQTALNVAAGGRHRWASVFSGVWVLAILVAFSGIVGYVAVPTLAAILIFAAISSLRTHDIVDILRTGMVSQIALVTTFLATLFLPITAAVGVGVAISLILQLNRDALDLRLVELAPLPSGLLEERPPPARLPSHAVTLLDVYGSLYHAGARTLGAKLPEVGGSSGSVVVLRLRGRRSLGATGLAVIASYGSQLAERDGRLYLSGVEPHLLEQLRRTGRVAVDGPIRAYEATSVLGASSRRAYEDAEAWLVKEETRN